MAKLERTPSYGEEGHWGGACMPDSTVCLGLMGFGNAGDNFVL